MTSSPLLPTVLLYANTHLHKDWENKRMSPCRPTGEITRPISAQTIREGDSDRPKQQVMNQPYQTSGPRYDLSTHNTHTSCILRLHPPPQLDVATMSSVFVTTQWGGCHGTCLPSSSLSAPLSGPPFTRRRRTQPLHSEPRHHVDLLQERGDSGDLTTSGF